MTPEAELMCGGVVWPAMAAVLVPFVLGVAVARILQGMPGIGLGLSLGLGLVATTLQCVGRIDWPVWIQCCLGAFGLGVSSCGECLARHLERSILADPSPPSKQ